MIVKQFRFMVDTNIILDYLDERDEFYEKARLLALCAQVGEFELWASASQFTDLVYLLSDGGKSSLMPEVLERLRALRSFVYVCPLDSTDIDAMLESGWKDPEDYIIYAGALSVGADAILTRDQKDFQESSIRVFDCDELFRWLEEDHDLIYEEVPF